MCRSLQIILQNILTVTVTRAILSGMLKTYVVIADYRELQTSAKQGECKVPFRFHLQRLQHRSTTKDSSTNMSDSKKRILQKFTNKCYFNTVTFQ